MIGDLLERLRVPCATADSKQAADEIERLRALNAGLVAALEPFAVEDKVSLIETLGHINRGHIEKARAAFARARLLGYMVI